MNNGNQAISVEAIEQMVSQYKTQLDAATARKANAEQAAKASEEERQQLMGAIQGLQFLIRGVTQQGNAPAPEPGKEPKPVPGEVEADQEAGASA